MGEQRLLFQPRRKAWVNRLWRQVSVEKRREVISILAEMARRSLTPRSRKDRKEGSDES